MEFVFVTLLANVASTWFMTGLIWFVQIVHYPQFGSVGPEAFPTYHLRHTRLTTWVVGPPMLIEAITTLALFVRGSPAVPLFIGGSGLFLLSVVWLSTVALQVPRHNELSRGWSDRAGQFLCTSNWIRTVAWSARALLMLYAVWRLSPFFARIAYPDFKNPE
jgi:hypothetical protein